MKGFRAEWRPRRAVVADKGPARQIDVETRIFALKREWPPETGSLKTPEGIFFANVARTDGGIGEMEIGAAGIRSVYEERLIVASLARSDATADMQNLGHAVEFAVDGCPSRACGEGYILIPGEAGEERRVHSRGKTLAENTRRQIHSGARNTPP